MSFKFGYIHVNRQNNISDIIIYHYKYNTRATPGRSQLVYYIKESLFNYMCVSGEVTREPGYVAKICYTRS